MLKIKTPEQIMANKKEIDAKMYQDLLSTVISMIEEDFKGIDLTIKLNGDYDLFCSVQHKIAKDFLGTGWRVKIFSIAKASMGDPASAKFLVSPKWGSVSPEVNPELDKKP